MTEPVAQQIVQRAMKIIPHNVNVMDRAGIIIGTGLPERKYQVHAGALKVLETGIAFDVSASQAVQLEGVQPGINRPIRFRREIIGVVGVTGNPESVSQFADLVVMTAELMVENASVISEIHWNKRQRENVVSEMIYGEAERDELFEVRTRKLGIDPDIPRVAILVSAKTREGKDLKVHDIESIQQLLSDNQPENLVALVCPTQVIVLHRVSIPHKWHPDQVDPYLVKIMKRIESFADIDYRIAVGRYVPGLNGLAISYQSAQEAFQVGAELDPNKRLYRYYDYQMDSLMLELKNSWKGKELLHLIEPLIEKDSRGVLQKTLRRYIDSRSDVGVTASSLYIHRNTLNYRLDRIRKLTGRNPRHFNDLLFLHFSLRLHELKNCAIA
ncbi:sugar diacid recognition domain-containing protein [Sansalvadorimonas verongulae]|uniref:sugar diacid recognition domain-containing protein n=1 Tax=Sansalvadorimonas verongulae TaxID=2172824 RepID=UPI001E4D1BDC|nr:sugar diacid recognition domain-containing protein [Sansalvadorimonas verongulae]